MITACSSAHNTTPRYVPPAERTPLTADHPWPKNSFLVLGYHDVEDGAADQRYLSVRTSALSDQMAWLRDNGYNPISVQQILDAHDGKIVLPEKAVLLTFDDGYSSFYTRVWPLLKAYNWPALWAPVGSWVDSPANKKVDFGGLMTARDKFATWKMVEEMGKSPLVEVGAHTWNSHFGAEANPQGSKEPAVANRLFDKKTGTYETDEQYNRRINTDISLITNKIKSVTGKSPRAWVWPYGAANGTTLKLAKEHGYKMAFTLNEGLANAAFLDDIPRVLISDNPSLKRFASQVAQVREPQTMRVMHVDLDYVYDKDPAQQKRNIDKLIQRVYDMRISHVFLQAYADPKGDGNIRELYFPNRWLPMRADLFNYISWQLQTRAGVTLDSMANVGHDYSTGIELSGSLQATSWWNTQINGSLYHYRVENEYKTDGKNETSTNYEIAWNNAFTAGKYTRIQLDGNFVGPSVTTQGRTQSFWFVNLAIRQQFFKRKLTATLSFRDVFNTARYVNTITSSNLISKTRIRPDYPLIGLTLSYTFNQFKLKNGLSNNSKDLFEGTNH